MLNIQPPEKLVRDVDTPLSVHSIFYTIQGEGPYAGHPAVFVRLAGCNLQCPLCDTEYTAGRRDMSPNGVVDAVRATGAPVGTLVVVTGGEPLRQPLAPMLRALWLAEYYRVQVETNGTLPLPGAASGNTRLWWTQLVNGAGTRFVVSPKTNRVQSCVARHAMCVKYVGKAGELCPDDGLPLTALDNPTKGKLWRPTRPMPIYLQPADEKDAAKNQANIDACVDSCLRFGYIMQLQTHKIMGVE